MKDEIIAKLIAENPEFQLNIIAQLADIDPSENGDYLPFIVSKSKDYVTEYFQKGLYIQEIWQEMIPIIKEFHEYRDYIENLDINSYPHVSDMIKAIETAKRKKELNDLATEH